MLKSLTLAATLLISSAVFAQAPSANPTQDAQKPQAGGPSIADALGCKADGIPCNPRFTRSTPRFYYPPARMIRPITPEKAPELADAGKYCSYIAGLTKHTMTVRKKPNGGFVFDCEIEDPKPE